MATTGQHPLGEQYAQCTGCAACAAVCPEHCIRMEPDAEGFLHPQIRTEQCVDCGRCRQVCPINDPAAVEGCLREPRQVFAAWHLDETIRQASSSGGVFTALAHAVLGQGGVVVGAAFDEKLTVRHVLIDTIAVLPRLRGSKYVQSEVTPELHQSIRDALNAGRAVLFSGTPCQVAGLRRFLGGAREGLICCGMVCHGVPAPLLLASYILHKEQPGRRMLQISFRDKRNGWKKPVVHEVFQSGESSTTDYAWAHPYTAAFLQDCALRECCYCCSYTSTKRSADLTLGDFWGVGGPYPEYDRDDKGTSLVLVNTEVGEHWLNACADELFLGPAAIGAALPRNPMLTRPAERPSTRDDFYKDLREMDFPRIVRRYGLHLPPLWRRMARLAKRKTKRLIRRIGRTLRCVAGGAP